MSLENRIIDPPMYGGGIQMIGFRSYSNSDSWLNWKIIFHGNEQWPDNFVLTVIIFQYMETRCRTAVSMVSQTNRNRYDLVSDKV
ncbi:hypothetical protein CEXT_191721 [Caerostris extrusa]|uniref:Uncharacterized protein n=1 Tax=Caerostris extrusa TaxID=172846 RepID=A0AAV4NGU2_CAEEX|nr:hypothetical protein CEXT_191721 [Caerostris extrusa]